MTSWSLRHRLPPGACIHAALHLRSLKLPTQYPAYSPPSWHLFIQTAALLRVDNDASMQLEHIISARNTPCVFVPAIFDCTVVHVPCVIQALAPLLYAPSIFFLFQVPPLCKLTALCCTTRQIISYPRHSCSPIVWYNQI